MTCSLGNCRSIHLSYEGKPLSTQHLRRINAVSLRYSGRTERLSYETPRQRTPPATIRDGRRDANSEHGRNAMAKSTKKRTNSKVLSQHTSSRSAKRAKGKCRFCSNDHQLAVERQRRVKDQFLAGEGIPPAGYAIRRRRNLYGLDKCRGKVCHAALGSRAPRCRWRRTLEQVRGESRASTVTVTRHG